MTNRAAYFGLSALREKRDQVGIIDASANSGAAQLRKKRSAESVASALSTISLPPVRDSYDAISPP